MMTRAPLTPPTTDDRSTSTRSSSGAAHARLALAVAALLTFTGCAAGDEATDDEGSASALRNDDDTVIDSVIEGIAALDPSASGVETWSVLLVRSTAGQHAEYYTVARGFRKGRPVVDLDLTASASGAVAVQPVEVSYVADDARVHALGAEMNGILPKLDPNDCRARYALRAVKAGAGVLGAAVISAVGCVAIGSGYLTWAGVAVCPAGLAAGGYAAVTLVKAAHARAACSALPEKMP